MGERALLSNNLTDPEAMQLKLIRFTVLPVADPQKNPVHHYGALPETSLRPGFLLTGCMIRQAPYNR